MNRESLRDKFLKTLKERRIFALNLLRRMKRRRKVKYSVRSGMRAITRSLLVSNHCWKLLNQESLIKLIQARLQNSNQWSCKVKLQPVILTLSIQVPSISTTSPMTWLKALSTQHHPVQTCTYTPPQATPWSPARRSSSQTPWCLLKGPCTQALQTSILPTQCKAQMEEATSPNHSALLVATYPRAAMRGATATPAHHKTQAQAHSLPHPLH